MSGSSDIRYGRRGGRVVAAGAGTPIEDMPRCELCDRPMVVGPAGGQHGAHVVCREAAAARGRVSVDAHTCHAEGCVVHVPPRLLMCARHWRMVPKRLRDALWAVYVPGQEDRKDPTGEYITVARQCIDAVAVTEGRRP